MSKGLRVVVAAGGSGGHVLPGIALAEYMLSAGGIEHVLFIGADSGLEKRIVPSFGFGIRTLPVGRVRGMKLAVRVSGLMGMGASVPKAMSILKEFGADVVVGLGGFASAPAIMAAYLMRKPCVVCEQNTIPGSTNRWLARFARRVCVTYAMSSAYLPSWKVVVTGNPVRPSVAAVREKRANRAAHEGLRVLVLGGSQGAQFLNKTMASALASFASAHGDVEVVHQSGASREGEAAPAYKGVKNVRVVGYIEGMAELLEWADLVVARAGATTLAELACVGLPSLLVPFPFATDNHQFFNAKAMERAGGAKVFLQDAFNENSFREVLEGLYRDRGALAAMGRNAAGEGRPDAAMRVVETLKEAA